MRARKLLAAVAAIGLLLALVAGPAGAGASVTVDSATSDGSTVTVVGTAEFTPITEPQSVGGFRTGGFQVQDVSTAAGLDIVDAKIIPLADGSGLRFIWEVSELPPEVPPEGVRYTWAFQVADSTFQLQAKRTNMASSTTVEDPVNHVLQLQEGEFFQLRGACQGNYLGTPVSGCYHLAFLDGAFDTENGTISMDLPFSTRDSIGRLVAEDFTPGSVLVANETASMSIAASFQAVVSNTASSNYINGWNQYFTAPVVQLGVGRSTSSPEFVGYTADATVAEDGTFSGSVSGLSATNDTVFVRACYGAECAYSSVTP